jgi:SAM-dependent MidA family methyltransferase
MIPFYTEKSASATAEVELAAALRAQIQQAGGALSFELFMETVLYHPRWGYYSANARRAGRKGDFFTSVSVGPLFGAVLARQFFQMWEIMGTPSPFLLIEQGAMDGQLLTDVFEEMKRSFPEFYQAARGRIIEPFSTCREAQQKTVEASGLKNKIEWAPSAVAAQPVEGIYFSNELVDSFPVRLVVFRGGQWLEKCVRWGGDSFAWVEQPITDQTLNGAIETRKIPQMEGYTTEINLRSSEWIEQTAQVLKRGFVLTIDYGCERQEYYHPSRAQGTLQCYRAHKKNDNPLDSVGCQDITCHVDFTGLIEAGQTAGLDFLGLVDQNRFCVGVASEAFENNQTLNAVFGPGASQAAWQTLTNPAMMGARFQCLIQSKGVNNPVTLQGLRYAPKRPE